MHYEDAVEAAAAALARGEDANWDLARLTYEHTNRGGEAHKATHKQWAEDVRRRSERRFSESMSKHYARMWERFGVTNVTERPSWAEAWYEVVPRDNPENMRARQTDIHLQETAPERKREIFERLTHDPDVIADDLALEAIETNPHLQRRLTERAMQRKDTGAERTARIAEGDPIAREIDTNEALLDLERACRQFADAVRNVLPRCPEYPAGDEFLGLSIERALEAARLVETYQSTGRTDIDLFLESVLGQET